MSFDKEFDLDHLLFRERTCRKCKIKKDLLSDFYLIRKNKKGYPSSYSYECKDCTIERITNNRKIKDQLSIKYEYPDW